MALVADSNSKLVAHQWNCTTIAAARVADSFSTSATVVLQIFENKFLFNKIFIYT